MNKLETEEDHDLLADEDQEFDLTEDEEDE